MKKAFTLLLFLISIPYSYSQHYYVSVCEDCYGSIEIGGIVSTISGIDGNTVNAGFYAGYYQFKPISDNFSFRSGVSYNNIGTKVTDYDTPLVIHAIDVPLSLHYILKEKYQFFAGGEIGTNIFGKLPTKNDIPTNTSSDSFTFRENFKTVDGSVFVGAGLIFIEHIDVNLKFNVGLTNISNSNFENYKKNWVTLSAGYTFR